MFRFRQTSRKMDPWPANEVRVVSEHPGIPLQYLARVLSPDEPMEANPFELPAVSLTAHVKNPWKHRKPLLSPPSRGPHLNRVLPVGVQRELEYQQERGNPSIVWGWTHSDPPAVLTSP